MAAHLNLVSHPNHSFQSRYLILGSQLRAAAKTSRQASRPLSLGQSARPNWPVCLGQQQQVVAVNDTCHRAGQSAAKPAGSQPPASKTIGWLAGRLADRVPKTGRAGSIELVQNELAETIVP